MLVITRGYLILPESPDNGLFTGGIATILGPQMIVASWAVPHDIATFKGLLPESWTLKPHQKEE